MTKDKSFRSGAAPFNLDALEKMNLKKTPGASSFKPSNYQMERSIAKPGKKFDPLKHSNPWSQEIRAESEKKPAVISKPDSQNISPKKEKQEPIIEVKAPASVRPSATTSTEDTVAPENDSAPAPVSKENTVLPKTVLPKEDEKSRIVESVIEQAGEDRAKEKVKGGSRYTDKTIKEIVTNKTARKSGKKKTHVEVEPLGSAIAGAISKGIGGVINTGKAVAGAASSGAQAVKDAVKPVAPAHDGASEKIKEKSVLSASAQTATALTEKVADGVLTVGLGAGRMAGYVVRGAVAAPVDVARGVSDLIVTSTSNIRRLCVGSKKNQEGRVHGYKKEK